MRNESTKPAGIREIAAALRIPIGTVDRALHNRPGVNEKTRNRVLAMAEKLVYRPNLAARNLKLNRRLRIGVFLPKQISSYFDPLREGVRAAATDAHGLDVALDFAEYPRIGKGDFELIESKASKHYDGLILTPGKSLQFVPLVKRLAAQNIAVIFVGSDLPGAERLASVTIDAEVSGGLAAELFSRAIQRDASVAVITGDLGTEDHAEKLGGFAATLAMVAPHLSLLPTVEIHERPEEAHDAVLKLIAKKPRVAGIYVNTANSLPILRALEERKLLDQIQVITTDLYPELVPLIRSGMVLASLYQRPYTQGKTGFETLMRYLVQHISPQLSTKLAPHIIMRSNLALFTRALDKAEEEFS
ncbi:MAG: LacI family DNA-binding transcriptional regulator [Silvibacterium sp.]